MTNLSLAAASAASAELVGVVATKSSILFKKMQINRMITEPLNEKNPFSLISTQINAI